jgi:hypothetical protein
MSLTIAFNAGVLGPVAEYERHCQVIEIETQELPKFR